MFILDMFYYLFRFVIIYLFIFFYLFIYLFIYYYLFRFYYLFIIDEVDGNEKIVIKESDRVKKGE